MTQMPQNAGSAPAGQEGLDLSAVRHPGRAGADAPAGGAAASGTPRQAGPGEVLVPDLVFDVTEETFNDVVQLSAQVPVVIDLWAEWCGPCKQLSPVIERAVRDLHGRAVLGKVDVDANPRLQQAFQVQSIPTIIALIQGQPVPLFQGAQPEAQVKAVLDQLVQLAGQQGMTKTAVPANAPVDEQPVGPAHPEAIAALEAGDLDRAKEIYRAALAEAPADDEAKLGLTRVELLERTKDQDPARVRAAAANDSKNVSAALECADLDVVGGHVDDAFSRLLGLLPGLTGEDKETVRLRLLDLFEVVGATDARVVKARARLMRALF